MKTVEVEFLANCADDKVGEVKRIAATRAIRLERAGYVRVLAENEMVEAPDNAMRPKAKPRVIPPESRG